MKSNRLRIDEQAGWAEYLIFVDVLLIPNNAIYIITKHLDIEMKTWIIHYYMIHGEMILTRVNELIVDKDTNFLEK